MYIICFLKLEVFRVLFFKKGMNESKQYFVHYIKKLKWIKSLFIN
jgi:hypothetical protein